MKICALSLVLCAASCASVPPRTASSGAGDDLPASRLAFHVGERAFDGSDWEPVEDQGVLGLEFVHEAPGSIVGLEAALFASGHIEDDYFVSPTLTADFRGRTSELSFGVRKTMPVDYGGVHPYFGGGLSLLRAELRGDSNGAEAEDDDDSAGVYVHGGVEFDASAALFLGLDLRLRGGTDVDLLGEERSAGYGQVTIVLGVRF